MVFVQTSLRSPYCGRDSVKKAFENAAEKPEQDLQKQENRTEDDLWFYAEGTKQGKTEVFLSSEVFSGLPIILQ